MSVLHYLTKNQLENLHFSAIIKTEQMCITMVFVTIVKLKNNSLKNHNFDNVDTFTNQYVFYGKYLFITSYICTDAVILTKIAIASKITFRKTS